MVRNLDGWTRIRFSIGRVFGFDRASQRRPYFRAARFAALPCRRHGGGTRLFVGDPNLASRVLIPSYRLCGGMASQTRVRIQRSLDSTAGGCLSVLPASVANEAGDHEREND